MKMSKRMYWMKDQTELIQELLDRIDRLEKENTLLKEQNAYLTKKLYGQGSETSTSIGLPVGGESFCVEKSQRPKGVSSLGDRSPRMSKKKFSGQRKEQFSNLPREKQVYRLPEEQQICPNCTNALKGISESFVRSEVVFIPAKLKVVDFYRESYECRYCKKKELPAIHKTSTPAPVIPHSYTSASSIAQIIVQKFVNAVPFYRQENIWKQTGFPLKRQTMSNWILQVSEEYLFPLVDRLQEKLLEEHYIHADETRLEVMNEPNRKNPATSFMWLYSTKEDASSPIRIFDYTETRNGDHAKNFLKGFCGYLISDAFQGYEKVSNVIRCFCWSHLRRYFVEALPTEKSKKIDSLSETAIRYCGLLFQWEREFKDLTPEKRKQQRQKKTLPLLKEFWTWIDQNKENCLPKSKLFKAFQYALNQKNGLMQFLQDGNIASLRQ